MTTIFILSLVFLVIGFIFQFVKANKDWIIFPRVMFFILAIIFAAIYNYHDGMNIGFDDGYKQGQIEMLKDNPKYEMEITYKKIDGEYVPTDTIYVKIN